MAASLERLWVSWLNSDRWRRFAKWGPGARLFRTDLYRSIDRARRYTITELQCRMEPAAFQDVQTFCFFVGHTKSGGTLLGSLLDAHPAAILADEADALAYVAHGFRREQIFHILRKTSRREAMKGRVTARRLTPYSLRVPGQWQGRYRTPRVIGDSKAGPSTRRLGRDLTLVHQTERIMAGVGVKVIHVVRNPYDPISLMRMRSGRTFDNAIDHYFAYCDTLAALRARMDSSQLLTVRYEAFVREPSSGLRTLCDFLGLECSDAYLQACIAILHPTPERSRDLVAWDPHWIRVVQRNIEQYDFLAGYSYDQ